MRPFHVRLILEYISLSHSIFTELHRNGDAREIKIIYFYPFACLANENAGLSMQERDKYTVLYRHPHDCMVWRTAGDLDM